MLLPVLLAGISCNTALADVRLINSKTGKIISTLENGSVLAKDMIGSTATFQYIPDAAIKGKVLSVLFKVSGAAKLSFNEKQAPFCFLGNKGSTCNRGRNFGLGNYTLQVSALLKDNSKKVENFTFSIATDPLVLPTVVPTRAPTVVPTTTYR